MIFFHFSGPDHRNGIHHDRTVSNSAPRQLEPAPAVQPKQWRPTAIA